MQTQNLLTCGFKELGLDDRAAELGDAIWLCPTVLNKRRALVAPGLGQESAHRSYVGLPKVNPFRKISPAVSC